AQPAPGLPCALCSQREQRIGKAQANSSREIDRACFHVIARSEATKQSRFLVLGRRKLDCFASLAMTAMGCPSASTQLAFPAWRHHFAQALLILPAPSIVVPDRSPAKR